MNVALLLIFNYTLNMSKQYKNDRFFLFQDKSYRIFNKMPFLKEYFFKKSKIETFSVNSVGI